MIEPSLKTEQLSMRITDDLDAKIERLRGAPTRRRRRVRYMRIRCDDDFERKLEDLRRVERPVPPRATLVKRLIEDAFEREVVMGRREPRTGTRSDLLRALVFEAHAKLKRRGR